MDIFRNIPAKSFAVTRINKLTGRVFAAGVLIASVEVYLNFFSQLPYLVPVWAWVGIAGLTIAHGLLVYSSWFMESPVLGQRSYTIATFLMLLTWSWQIDLAHAPQTFTPWLWWLLGSATISAALSLPPLYAGLYALALPTAWFIMHQTEVGGSSTTLGAAQDAIYTFLFSGSFSMLLLLLRTEARKTDIANQEAAEAEAERARVDAVEQERARVDALVHDKVLTTLVVAARANTGLELQNARELADTAVAALEQDLANQNNESSTITVWSLFGAFLEAVKSEYPDVKVQESGASDLEIPNQVAIALTEAMMQAIHNSKLHAGTGSTCVVRLKGYEDAVKIVIKDDGRGFRPSRIPKDRLGVRLSIINRVESVGGRVFLDTEPGKGATVILEWSRA